MLDDNSLPVVVVGGVVVDNDDDDCDSDDDDAGISVVLLTDVGCTVAAVDVDTATVVAEDGLIVVGLVVGSFVVCETEDIISIDVCSVFVDCFIEVVETVEVLGTAILKITEKPETVI